MKLLVIGLDGAEYGFFRRYFGMSCLRLHAPIPFTMPSWTTIYTGAKLERHQVRNWGDPWPQDVEPFWAWLTKAGLRCGVFMPPAIRADAVKPEWTEGGWLLSGGAAFGLKSESVVAQPAELMDELPENFETYCDESAKVTGDTAGAMRDELSKLSFFEAFTLSRAVTEMRVRAFLELVKRRPVDVGWIAFDSIDRWGHFWHSGIDGQGLLATYTLMAYAVDWLREAVRPDCMVVVSDHGFRWRNNHTRMGVFGWDGGGFPWADWSGEHPEAYENCHVAATLAGLSGGEAADYAAGPMVTQDEFGARRWAEYEPEGLEEIYTAEEAAELARRLAARGYDS